MTDTREESEPSAEVIEARKDVIRAAAWHMRIFFPNDDLQKPTAASFPEAIDAFEQAVARAALNAVGALVEAAHVLIENDKGLGCSGCIPNDAGEHDADCLMGALEAACDGVAS